MSRIFKLLDKPKLEGCRAHRSSFLKSTSIQLSGIMPLYFGPVPSSGIPYPSVIVEVTPDEFERIKVKELELPNGWAIAEEYANGTE